MKPIRLSQLIAFLDQQTAQTFKGTDVDHFFATHFVEPEEAIPFSQFREDTYARNQVKRTDLYELLVLAWLPGQNAAPHNHADQRCWTQVLLGSLDFQNYHPALALDNGLVPCGGLTRCEAGQGNYIDDGAGLHSIANSGRVPTLSLHLYAGPIDRCAVYDVKARSFKQVALQSFPPPPETEWIEAHPGPLG
jgi:predicted metal-dependent enzyme (double-stranded beta helix superfamily)